MINILNIYDTKYGNTRKIAEAIGRILSKRNIFAVVTINVENVLIDDILKSDVIIIGSPTHYWRPTERIKRFLGILKQNRIRNKFGAVYATKLAMTLSGGAGRRIVNHLKILQFFIISHPLDFYVKGIKGPLIKGEIEKGEGFAEYISGFLHQLNVENLMAKRGF